MRERPLRMEKYGVSPERYAELKAFCRQYPEKKRKADSLLGAKSPILTGMPRGSGGTDPVHRAAEKRERLLRDVNLIETAAAETKGGAWARALIRNCCYRVRYEDLRPDEMPSCNRSAYFEARREFFIRLDAMRE